jgi:hypothetical protein
MRLTSLLVAALATAISSCSSSSNSSPASDTVTQDVGPEGGQIQLDGATLTFPPQALVLKKTITITASDTAPPAGYVRLSKFFQCDPSGIDFQFPVGMQIPFTDDGAGKTPTVFWSSAFQPTFTDLNGTKGDDGVSVKANIMHFSSGFVGYKK